MAFNLLTPPQARLLLGTRWFDFRPLPAGLSDAERERTMALTPQGDRIFYAEVLNGYWAGNRIRNVRVPVKDTKIADGSRAGSGSSLPRAMVFRERVPKCALAKATTFLDSSTGN